MTHREAVVKRFTANDVSVVSARKGIQDALQMKDKEEAVQQLFEVFAWLMFKKAPLVPSMFIGADLDRLEIDENQWNSRQSMADGEPEEGWTLQRCGHAGLGNRKGTSRRYTAVVF